MTITISVQHQDSRLQGTVAFADSGPTNSTIEFYATAQPSPGLDAGGPALATVVLAKPCGTVSGGVLTLAQLDLAGDMATGTGTLLWARWLNGNGVMVADGAVTDDLGTGDFKIAGASGTVIYAGGSVLLGTTLLG